jgi:ABC-type polar amino acid transport system ATPase subunit
MLESISLKFGSSQGQPPLTFDPGSMTVFVGPNNSGKSIILHEIEDLVRMHYGVNKIIQSVIQENLTEEDVRRVFIEERDLLGSNILVDESTGSINIIDPMRGTGVGYGELLNRPELIRSNLKGISQGLLSHSTVRLDGNTRLTILNPSSVGDLQQAPSGVLGALFRNDSARQRLRELTYDAFGLYFIIDPSGMASFRVRMSSVAPQDQERSLTNAAVEFFKQATVIDQFSDGVKAFTGLLAAVLCSRYLLMLIDEPEAFLHPPLIRKLGRKLTEIAAERGGSVLASTHSADFLIGSIQAGKNVNVVRLTYRQGLPTARLLKSSRLEEMMRNPFMRSTGVLSALFHEGAIICEADTDRAFYQEVNERLLAFNNDGIDNSIFLNSNGKDTLRHLAQPLREMGIAAAVIVDLDVIKPGTLKPLLQACFVPPALVDNYNQLRDQIYNVYKNRGLDPKDVGLTTLNSSDREVTETLINHLEEYGIFVVNVGEVEKWLPELGASGHGPYWLTQIFEKMGTDPKDSKYLRPKADDVWGFLGKVAKWIRNPKRKGIPE